MKHRLSLCRHRGTDIVGYQTPGDGFVSNQHAYEDTNGYLALYNGMFILPLMGVFGVAYCGVTSERMAAMSRRNIGLTKLALGLLFLALAVVLISTAL